MRTWSCLFVVVANLLAQADWGTHGGNYAAWRYSSLAQIHTSNVGRLTPAWSFQTGDIEHGLQATPIVQRGVMYVSTSQGWVIALNAADGRLIWEYRYAPENTAVYGKQNRGVAVSQGMVLLGTADNHAVGIDAQTGKEKWRVNMEDTRQCGCNITGAPLAVKDVAVFGVTGGDSAHRGYLTALNIRTGRFHWRFYTIPGPEENGHETWPGDSWRHGGGSTWMTGSYDAELNLLYWGVGNAAGDILSKNRRGDNLYTASVVALNPDTGKLVWHYQEVPHDVWDYDSVYELVLADLPVAGKMRKLLFHSTKAGYTWLLDRSNGEFIKAWQFVKHSNWVAGITEGGKLVGRRDPEIGKGLFVCPSAMGGKSWNESAWSPRTGLLYLPVVEACNDLMAREQEPQEGQIYIGGSWIIKPPPDGKIEGYLAAFDPLTGSRKWSLPGKTWFMASLLATAGDLLFTGDPEGNFFALDARDGKKLWSFQTGGGHRGGAITYAVNGRQYVATPLGWGSFLGMFHLSIFPDAPAPRAGSALMVFALPEVGQ
ncbi:MAG: PQQ-dependent dehydrogenase, methanol/ethanol family [Acidimicrobiia bacterium]|nr:PQQ-dependent dehydrogenase, methanol/ethanol family [Acidimicrobiia bacterium]